LCAADELEEESCHHDVAWFLHWNFAWGHLYAAKFTLARILVKEGKDDNAALLLEYVIRTNPKDVDARVELADIHHRTGQYEAAVRILQEALSFDPRSSRAHFLLGKAFTRLGKPAEAEQHLKTFQDLEKSGPETQSEKPTVYTQSVK
jgi:Flp pilus assembly protein TadD